jgi:ribokinase
MAGGDDMGRVVVLGSINSDLVVQVPRLPRPGETVLGGRFAVYGGGKGANQAIAAARAGGQVALIGGLGDDSYGDERTADLLAAGVDVADVRRLTGVASGVALIGVEASGQNVILVASGANMQVTSAMATAIEWQPGDVLLQQLEIPFATVKAGLEHARGHGVRTLLNAAPFDSAVVPLLPLVDVLIVNEVEAADLVGQPIVAFDRATFTRLAALGPRQIVVTLGGEGIVSWDDEQLAHTPALAVTPIDTTGAGDCFCGVVAAGLATGRSLGDAVRLGVVASGLAVTRPGAQSSMPYQPEIEAALPGLGPTT